MYILIQVSYLQLVPGPPFVFGAFLVICALLVAAFIPESGTATFGSTHSSGSRRPSGKYAYQKCTLKLDDIIFGCLRTSSWWWRLNDIESFSFIV